MKNLKLVLLVLVAIFLGYLVGSFFPIKGSIISILPIVDQGIIGETQLVVTAKMADRGNPVSNVEINLASQPGPPPKGGVAWTDDSGEAIFMVQPGEYVIYFNDYTFPQNLEMPELAQIEVLPEVENKYEILFSLK